jgi:hypothetical protein
VDPHRGIGRAFDPLDDHPFPVAEPDQRFPGRAEHRAGHRRHHEPALRRTEELGDDVGQAPQPDLLLDAQQPLPARVGGGRLPAGEPVRAQSAAGFLPVGGDVADQPLPDVAERDAAAARGWRRLDQHGRAGGRGHRRRGHPERRGVELAEPAGPEHDRALRQLGEADPLTRRLGAAGQLVGGGALGAQGREEGRDQRLAALPGEQHAEGVPRLFAADVPARASGGSSADLLYQRAQVLRHA